MKTQTKLTEEQLNALRVIYRVIEIIKLKDMFPLGDESGQVVDLLSRYEQKHSDHVCIASVYDGSSREDYYFATADINDYGYVYDIDGDAIDEYSAVYCDDQYIHEGFCSRQLCINNSTGDVEELLIPDGIEVGQQFNLYDSGDYGEYTRVNEDDYYGDDDEDDDEDGYNSYHSSSQLFADDAGSASWAVGWEYETYRKLDDKASWESHRETDSSCGYEHISKVYNLFGTQVLEDIESFDLDADNVNRDCGGHMSISHVDHEHAKKFRMFFGVIMALYYKRLSNDFCRQHDCLYSSHTSIFNVRYNNTIELRLFSRIRSKEQLKKRVVLLREIARAIDDDLSFDQAMQERFIDIIYDMYNEDAERATEAVKRAYAFQSYINAAKAIKEDDMQALAKADFKEEYYNLISSYIDTNSVVITEDRIKLALTQKKGQHEANS